LNPSFKPPTPLSNELRDSIFTMHMANPEVNTARKLSYEYGLSISRIEAILKLKFVEIEWRKVSVFDFTFFHPSNRLRMNLKSISLEDYIWLKKLF
jgi:hypothetical protein